MLPARTNRMTNLTAAVARPQIGLVEEKGRRYREMYSYLQRELTATNRIEFPRGLRRRRASPTPSSSGCRGSTPRRFKAFIARVRETGLPLSGFIERHNARVFYNWRYLGEHMPDLPRTRRAIENTCDMRLPSTLQGGASRLYCRECATGASRSGREPNGGRLMVSPPIRSASSAKFVPLLFVRRGTVPEKAFDHEERNERCDDNHRPAQDAEPLHGQRTELVRKIEQAGRPDARCQDDGNQETPERHGEKAVCRVGRHAQAREKSHDEDPGDETFVEPDFEGRKARAARRSASKSC